jgi:hypothetical protein
LQPLAARRTVSSSYVIFLPPFKLDGRSSAAIFREDE